MRKSPPFPGTTAVAMQSARKVKAARAQAQTLLQELMAASTRALAEIGSTTHPERCKLNIQVIRVAHMSYNTIRLYNTYEYAVLCRMRGSSDTTHTTHTTYTPSFHVLRHARNTLSCNHQQAYLHISSILSFQRLQPPIILIDW